MSEEKINTEKAKSPPLNAKEELGEFFKTALIAIFFALLIRSLFFEPFNIPSGSMKPTLQVGDYLFVSKSVYGYSKYSFPFGLAPIEGRVWSEMPKRGDVIVFKLPTNPKVDYIKRVVALPDETVQVKDGRLYINGELVPREEVGEVEVDDPATGTQVMTEYIETLPGGVQHRIYEESDHEPLDETPLYRIPEDHFFVMGDNRDNSQDSRVGSLVGDVPFDHIVGKADFLFYSTNGYARLFEPWKWPWTVRYDRLFMDIGPKENE